jgi:hypothetical protein
LKKSLKILVEVTARQFLLDVHPFIPVRVVLAVESLIDLVILFCFASSPRLFASLGNLLGHLKNVLDGPCFGFIIG